MGRHSEAAFETVIERHLLDNGYELNVVSADTLRAAQADPEAHRGLIVRVAGYSDYFCDLGESLQDEIISRTEHGEV